MRASSLKQLARRSKLILVFRRFHPTLWVALALLAAPASASASADQSVSSNWAGYAAHRTGVHFRSVRAVWRQPAVSCHAGADTFSAMWVGLGGFSQTSPALEQIGSEVDCTRSGRLVSSAWYELVPAPSQPIRMTVRPGDVMSARVSLRSAGRVTMTLTDVTRRRTFTRTFHPAVIDDTAAEWILEAPSACTSDSNCQTLPLADFGSAAFGLAAASAGSASDQPISGLGWDATRIALVPGSRRFVALGHGSGAGGAVPSALSAGGSSFGVAYEATPAQTTPVYGVRRLAGRQPSAEYLRH